MNSFPHFTYSDAVSLFLQHKANVHITDSIKGQTPLILAASLGHTESMRFLLDYSADPNCQDIFGNTPLHHGKIEENVFCLKYELYIQNMTMDCNLYVVVKETTDSNTETCIRQLAAYGAVCLRDNQNRSPIDILLDKKRTSVAETLIKLTCKLTLNDCKKLVIRLNNFCS